MESEAIWNRIGNYAVFPEKEWPEADYEAFVQGFEALTGIRLDLYKEKQMKRRIGTLIERKRLDGFGAFLALLRASPAELAAFKEYITINVTEFFRTPEHWAGFEEHVLPNLRTRDGEKLKIWSSACSTGEEAWSLAMSVCRTFDPSQFRILATDLDDAVLAAAAKGEYTDKSTANLPPELRERFFFRKGDVWQVSDELRQCVEFRKLDLLRDDYPSGCDLIVCRNVLIYFTEEAKNRIYARFQQSLRRGGYLFTGNTEQIIYYKNFHLKKIRNYLYQNEEKTDC